MNFEEENTVVWPIELQHGTMRVRLSPPEFLVIAPDDPLYWHFHVKRHLWGLNKDYWCTVAREWKSSLSDIATLKLRALGISEALNDKYVEAVETFMLEEDSFEKKGSV